VIESRSPGAWSSSNSPDSRASARFTGTRIRRRKAV
jgi:hypothetical protein